MTTSRSSVNRPILRRAAALTLTALLAACAAIPNPGDGPTRLQEWQSMLPELLEHTSDYQAEVIADGVVTRAELDAAFAEMQRCVIDHGGAIVDLEIGADGKIGQMTTSGSTAGVDQCRSAYFDEIQLGYGMLLKPDLTPGALVRAMVACLREEGIRVPPDADQLELSELAQQTGRRDADSEAIIAFSECYERHG